MKPITRVPASRWLQIFLISVFFHASLAFGKPELPPHILFRPTFLTADFSHNGGTAFVMRVPESGNSYFVSTHRVFGPAGGFEGQLTGADVARVFVAAAGVSVEDPEVVVVAKPAIEVTNASVAGENGPGRDVSLFKLEAWSIYPALQPKRGPVRKGDRVWIVMKSVETGKREMRSATIFSLFEGEIRYWLHDQEADYAGSSGAPIVSEDGELLGMHLGIFRNNKNERFGHALPVWVIEESAGERNSG